MGPKKAAKKDSGGGAGADGVELDSEMKAKFFQMTCTSLQVQLAERTEDASKAMAAKRELQARVEQISKDFEEEKNATFEITQDMTRQYKGMQEELLSRVSSRDKNTPLSISYSTQPLLICLYFLSLQKKNTADEFTLEHNLNLSYSFITYSDK